MTTKNALYDAHQAQGAGDWMTVGMEEPPPHPADGQHVWYISQGGQVWEGTYKERCYLSPEQYRISDKGSVFDSDCVFTVAAERVFVDRTAAYRVAMAEATRMVTQLYEEYEEGYVEALPPRPKPVLHDGQEVWWVEGSLRIRHGVVKRGRWLIGDRTTRVQQDRGAGLIVTEDIATEWLYITEGEALEERAMRQGWRREIAP